jgi:ribosomal protein S18 acetylase RimI-like enzyme
MRTSTMVRPAAPAEIDTLRTLFREYEASIGIDLCFQGFEAELASLPGDYAPPRGRLFLALAENGIAGCVALRPIDDRFCEMKRLFVRPQFRGLGIGRQLALSCIDAARGLDYATLRLDTLPMMREAIAMYRTLGFQEIAPYRPNPVEGALYMELALGSYPAVNPSSAGPHAR